jgi:hypothetical protein
MPIVQHFADLAYCRADCPGCSRNDHNLAWSRHSKIMQPKKSRQPIQAEDSERERQWQIAFLHFASDKFLSESEFPCPSVVRFATYGGRN